MLHSVGQKYPHLPAGLVRNPAPGEPEHNSIIPGSAISQGRVDLNDGRDLCGDEACYGVGYWPNDGI